MDASLYDRPDLYDLMSPRDAAMEAHYVEACRGRGGSVLELACGTGRLSIPLAQAGLEVTAGDLAEPMLARARDTAAEAGVAIDFRALDMRDFDLGRRFDSVVIAANSLLHLHDNADLRSCFMAIARHLAPQGRLLFDIFLPSLALLTRDPEQRHPIGRFGDGPDAPFVEETIRYDPIRQVSQIEWIWSRPGATEFWRHPLDMRQIFPQELEALLLGSGLRLLERYGDFDHSPLMAKSMRQVCVAATSICSHPS